MVKEAPVSLTRQTIYCLIPILDIYAAYRVRRLRKYLLIMLVFVVTPVSITAGILFSADEDPIEGMYNVMIFYYGVDENQFVFSILVQIGTVLFVIYLIRRWSKQWNSEFK